MPTPIIDSPQHPSKPELVYGVAAISQAIDEPNQRRVFYLLSHGQIPGAKKFGRSWVLSLRVFRREMHGEAI